jgi:hypothetical protein
VVLVVRQEICILERAGAFVVMGQPPVKSNHLVGVKCMCEGGKLRGAHDLAGD